LGWGFGRRLFGVDYIYIGFDYLIGWNIYWVGLVNGLDFVGNGVYIGLWWLCKYLREVII
jgi:hypothetical protein